MTLCTRRHPCRAAVEMDHAVVAVVAAAAAAVVLVVAVVMAVVAAAVVVVAVAVAAVETRAPWSTLPMKMHSQV